MVRCYIIGRSDSYDALVLARESVDGIILETTSFTYVETEACIPDELLEKIAKYYKKGVNDLTDEDVTEYMINVVKVKEKVSEFDHVFGIEW